jgi:molecular chaperone GrpE
MSSDEKTSGAPGEPLAAADFDAVAAAAELDATLAADAAATGASDGDVEKLEVELAELNALLERQQAEIAEAQGRANRASEEIAQARARLERDARRQAQQRVRDVLIAFLEVIDDADRAVAGTDGACREAVEVLRRRLEATLQAQGVSRQPALGERFDPARHEAIAAQPVNEAERDGQVLAVAREGYLWGEELLRPARVLVGKRAAT